MNRLKALFALAALGGILCGCSADKSGDVQMMQKPTATESPKGPGAMPDKARDAISKAAPIPGR